jgi:nitrite reductase/ring-hydroxylating ferredoxin subunit
MTGEAICALDDLDDPGARGFTLGSGKARRNIFLIRKDGAVFAYVNRCPHANQRLDARPGRFLTMDETQIICGGHAALFRIEDGFCTSGPCAGEHLEPIAVEVVDGVVRVIPATRRSL